MIDTRYTRKNNSVHYTVNSMHYIVTTLHYTVNRLHYIVTTVHYTMNSMHYIVTTVQCTAYTIQYTLCTLYVHVLFIIRSCPVRTISCM